MTKYDWLLIAIFLLLPVAAIAVEARITEKVKAQYHNTINLALSMEESK